MRKIKFVILILILLLLQGCIFQDQPPIIESMKPGNGEKINPGEVTFEWNAKDPEEKILKYNFYLYSNGVLKENRESLASNYIKIDLEEDTKYDWILEAVDLKGNKAKKAVSFETIFVNSEPIKSFLQYPQNNETDVYPYNLTFKWNKSLDFDGDMVFYDFYLSESTPLTTPFATALTDLTYTLDKLKLDTIYYWKIVSYDTYGASNTSETWSFKTADNTPPIVDFPKTEFIVKEGEMFELELKNYVSDMEDSYFEYQIVTNNGAMMESSVYKFKPGYDTVKHPNAERKIQEQLLISDTKDNTSGYLNIIVKDVNQNPDKPEFVYPINNSIVPKNIKLQWKCSDPDNDSLKYDLFIGNYPGNYSKIATDLTNTEYDLNLSEDTDYFIKIVAKDKYGGVRASDDLSFKTKKKSYNIEWEKSLSNILDIFPYNHKIIVVSDHGIYKLNTNGTDDEFIELNNIILNSVIFGKNLYVPDNMGNINVIDLDSFEVINTLNISTNILSITVSKDYQNNEYLYVLSDDGEISVYNLNTFSLAWRKKYNLDPYGSILIIENGYIVLIGEEKDKGKIILIKPKGKVYREIVLSQKLTSLIANDENSNLYFATGNTIYSYNKFGEKVWEITVSENIQNEILYDGDYLYASGENKIFKITKEGALEATYNSSNVLSKTLMLSETKNIYYISSDGIFKNNDQIYAEKISQVETYSLLNDGLLYFANSENLYAISIEERNILNEMWAKFGKNIYNNRDSYIRKNTSPEKPELVYPKNQSIEIPKKITLSWECEDLQDDNLSYEVYLGEGAEDLELIVITEETSYEIELENSKKYYWKIIASDGELSSESDIYSFNTIPTPAEEKFKIKVEGATIYSPAISEDNTIYFSTSIGNVYAYGSNGNKLWKYSTAGFIKTSVVLNPLNQIIIGNENGELHIINSDGNSSNIIKLKGPITKPVALGNNGEIYVITDIGNVYKFGAYGNEIWEKELKGRYYLKNRLAGEYLLICPWMKMKIFISLQMI
ncbi:MAG: hypothetical protein B6I29_04890 [Marinitoga sp. 4572_148]|nr:MAG: hypothetical protein B6I29_04890 [Marinitoga sp. 4572_148]